jgi:hypothetical protein
VYTDLVPLTGCLTDQLNNFLFPLESRLLVDHAFTRLLASLGLSR